MHVPFVLTRLAALFGIVVDRVLFKNDLRNGPGAAALHSA